MPDALGRPVIPNGAKDQIAAALKQIPEGKRGALLLFADNNGARAHLAAHINGTWKVAGGSGFRWEGKRTVEPWIAIEAAW